MLSCMWTLMETGCFQKTKLQTLRKFGYVKLYHAPLTSKEMFAILFFFLWNFKRLWFEHSEESWSYIEGNKERKLSVFQPRRVSRKNLRFSNPFFTTFCQYIKVSNSLLWADTNVDGIYKRNDYKFVNGLPTWNFGNYVIERSSSGGWILYTESRVLIWCGSLSSVHFLIGWITLINKPNALTRRFSILQILWHYFSSRSVIIRQ